MAGNSSVNGIAAGAVGIGALFLYGGIRGKSPLAAMLGIIQGKPPSTVPTTQQIGGGSADIPGSATPQGGTGNVSPGTTVANVGSVQSILQKTAARYGWGSGPEWQALNNIEMNEAGYNPQARNSSSGAFGIAQALGHGVPGGAAPDGTNEYGGFGLTTAQARAANSGDASAQALWMMNYIKSRYGTPSSAWAQYVHADGTKWY